MKGVFPVLVDDDVRIAPIRPQKWATQPVLIV